MPAALPGVALVTGSGKKRVGWYVADALAGQGYAVAVHYHTSASEADETVQHLRRQGVEAAAFQANWADGEAVRGLVRAAPLAIQLVRRPNGLIGQLPAGRPPREPGTLP